MAKKVRVIPATIDRTTSAPISSGTKRKVAGYARVSTELEEQQSSYEAQVSYYTNYIQSRNDWEFVRVYTDEGISATSTKHREGFQQMVEDALDGKIDLIVTKSVSRFARNTVDSLTTIRKLKEHGTAFPRTCAGASGKEQLTESTALGTPTFSDMTKGLTEHRLSTRSRQLLSERFMACFWKGTPTTRSQKS